MEKKFKWGILGSGLIAADFVKSLSLVADAQVVAVAARELKSAQEFASKFNIPKAYGSYEELVKDSEVEIVYVSVIHPYHKQGASLALNNGKHVLCEKPFTINAKETEDLIHLAKEKNLFLMEAFWTRFFPATHKICELIQQKAIGDVIGVQANFGFRAGNVPRLIDPNLGGGGLLDIGIYLVSFASIFLGNPTKVLATGDLLPSGVDGHGAISLHYKENQVASLLYSLKGTLPCTAAVMGTEGYIRIDKTFWTPLKITLVKGEKEETFEFKLPEGDYNFTNSVGLHYEAKHVQERIGAGHTESDLWPLEQTLNNIKTLDEIRRQIGVKYPQDQ